MNRYELKIKKQALEIKHLKDLLRESLKLNDKAEIAVEELEEIIEELREKQAGYELVLDRLSAPDDPLIR